MLRCSRTHLFYGGHLDSLVVVQGRVRRVPSGRPVARAERGKVAFDWPRCPSPNLPADTVELSAFQKAANCFTSKTTQHFTTKRRKIEVHWLMHQGISFLSAAIAMNKPYVRVTWLVQGPVMQWDISTFIWSFGLLLIVCCNFLKINENIS